MDGPTGYAADAVGEGRRTRAEALKTSPRAARRSRTRKPKVAVERPSDAMTKLESRPIRSGGVQAGRLVALVATVFTQQRLRKSIEE